MDHKIVCLLLVAMVVVSINASIPLSLKSNTNRKGIVPSDVSSDVEDLPSSTYNLRSKRQFYPGGGFGGASSSAFSSANAGGFGGFGGLGSSFAGAQASAGATGGGFYGKKK